MDGKHKTSILILVTVACFTLYPTLISAAPGRSISNEEIHNTVLSILQSFSMLDNKLERHEQRERSLGEIIKKSLMTLQNGQRIFAPMKGTFSRLEERVSQIETLLLTQEERNTDQQTKLGEALDSILKWMMSNGKKPTVLESSEENKEDLEKKIEELNKSVKLLTKEVSDLKALKNTDNENTMQIVKLIGSNSNSTETNILKINEKLSQIMTTNPSEIARSKKWESDVNEVLTSLKTNLSTLKSSSSEGSNIDPKALESINNITLSAIERMRQDVMEASENSFAKTASRLKETNDIIGKSVNDVFENAKETKDLLSNHLDLATQERAALKKDIGELKELEKMMLKTADNVLDTKRRVEFGIHQIVLEVSEAVKESSKEMNLTLNRRINLLDESISQSQSEGFSNLTTKIETEVNQVWRQIGIMFQEISAAKASLDKVQEYSETFVNDTVKSVNGAEEKIAAITVRMEEMYSNLNYLLGRLSLVNQEFNSVKTGLGAAIDNLKSSFEIIQKNVRDIGPGPHKIPDHELDEESVKTNLVKRLALQSSKNSAEQIHSE